jgi:hypothetical protein
MIATFPPARKRILLILALLFSLSCSLVTGAFPATEPAPIPTAQPAPNPTAEPALVEPPQSEPPSATLPLEIDYLYTTELITVLYPLYGDILDDFTIVTLTNPNEDRVRVVVESEIVGYTSLAIDTVDIEPYETIEVRQNPLLLPEVIDQLNAQKPANFHLTVFISGSVNIANYITQMRLANSLGDKPGIAMP